MVTKPASTAILGAEPPWIDYYETKSSHISHGFFKKINATMQEKQFKWLKLFQISDIRPPAPQEKAS